MKIDKVLTTKYPESSDMHRKLESTKVCMSYNELVQTLFQPIAFSEALSLRQGTLSVIVSSHLEAHQVKLYEYDVIQELNDRIQEPRFIVERLQIRMS